MTWSVVLDALTRDLERPMANIRDTEKAFIAEIQERPGDDALRLVYADWLEEQGDQRAEYLRLECELIGLGRGDALWEQCHERLESLRAEISEEWLADVGRSRVANCSRGDCPRSWTRLRQTDYRRVRMCEACGKPVTFMAHVERAAAFSMDHLVAVDALTTDHRFSDAVREVRHTLAPPAPRRPRGSIGRR